jgi:hypothetical protein
MTMLVIFAVLIGLAIKVAEDLFPRRVWGGPLGSALSLALGAVESFCLTPIMIALHWRRKARDRALRFRKRTPLPRRDDKPLNAFDGVMTFQYLSLANNRALAPGNST